MSEHRLAVRLNCPNATEEGHAGAVGYALIVNRTARGARFRCTDCLFGWSASEAQVRRLIVRWSLQ